VAGCSDSACTSLKRTLGLRACSVVRLIALVTVLTGHPAVVFAGDIEGRAKPVDGDSFNIEIRIFGIDAPEPGQTCKDAQGLSYPCGRIARDAIAELLKGKTVRCEKQAQDTKFGRPVAICYADGVDVGAKMVDRGLAVAYRRFSLKYVPNEDQAKAAKRGLWAGAFEMPGDYRARTLGGENSVLLIPSTSGTCPPPPPDPRPQQCAIKGNISGKKGQPRIYHMPGSRGYEAVAIAPAKGERYFCSEQEALACGWRKWPG
jgi:endonuclease YncB( thermonuclease family)